MRGGSCSAILAASGTEDRQKGKRLVAREESS
jgi:hypothetical protein